MFDRTVPCLEIFQGQTSVALGFLHPAPVGSSNKFYAQKQLQHLAEKKHVLFTQKGSCFDSNGTALDHRLASVLPMGHDSDDQPTLDSTFAQILHT